MSQRQQHFRASLELWINRLWYPDDAKPPLEGLGPRLLLLALTPLEVVFRCVVTLRHLAHRTGLLRAHAVNVPVVVLGNVSVGGTGKTPMTIYLANALTHEAGLRVGIITRGYRSEGSARDRRPRRITPRSDVQEAGDEAVLLARATRAPVVAGRDRVAAARLLEGEVDIILADDGLQHLRLARDLEIVLVDSRRRLGNRRLLPCGPLREPPSRLAGADIVVFTGPAIEGEPEDGRALLDSIIRGDRRRRGPAGTGEPDCLRAIARAAQAVPLFSGAQPQPLASFAGRPVHGVAGIAGPDRFFQLLRDCGLRVTEHPLDDHAAITPAMISFDDDLPVLMTDKDAVKCRHIADGRCWAVGLDLQMTAAARDLLVRRVVDLRPRE